MVLAVTGQEVRVTLVEAVLLVVNDEVVGPVAGSPDKNGDREDRERLWVPGKESTACSSGSAHSSRFTPVSRGSDKRAVMSFTPSMRSRESSLGSKRVPSRASATNNAESLGA